jgi:hypothetical protein
MAKEQLIAPQAELVVGALSVLGEVARVGLRALVGVLLIEPDPTLVVGRRVQVQRDGGCVSARVSDLVQTDRVLHVGRRTAGECHVADLHQSVVVASVSHFVDRAGDDVDPTPVTWVVVDRAVLTRIPHDQDERVRLVVGGNEVARVVPGLIRQREPLDVPPVVVEPPG